MPTHLTKRGLLAVATLLLALAALGALARGQLTAHSPGVAPARAATRPGLDPDVIAQLGYLPDPNAVKGGESDELLRLDAYWQTRVTYPTGKFDFRWLIDAAQQDRAQVRTAVPAGTVLYNPRNSQGPLALDPTRWISIGPQPEESNTCQAPCFAFGRVSGRTNDIVVDPVNPAVTYIASDGGGVW